MLSVYTISCHLIVSIVQCSFSCSVIVNITISISIILHFMLIILLLIINNNINTKLCFLAFGLKMIQFQG